MTIRFIPFVRPNGASVNKLTLQAAQIAAPALFLSLFLYNKHKKLHQTSSSSASADEAEPLKYHKLFQSEATFYNTDMPCISTLTWFRGDYKQAQEFLQRRLKKIFQKNPWLSGRIVKRRGVYYIAHSMEHNDNDGEGDGEGDGDRSEDISINLKNYFQLVPEDESSISREASPPGDLGLLTKKYMIKNGPNEPLFKVTVIPCQTCPKSKFAVICQMSHVVGDGATFYKLHEMLCSTDESILEEGLIFDRVDTFEKDSVDLLGKREHGFVTSPSYICLLLRGMLSTLVFGPKTEFKFAFVDHDKIQCEKESFLAGTSKSIGATASDDDSDRVSFVSTNDIITSWFMSNTGCAYGIMPINLRNRLKGITSSHAGNYENVLFYQCQADVTCPSLIRRSIKRMKRIVTQHGPFPGFASVVRKSCAIVTNWQTFATPNVIPGCEEDLHLPIAPLSVWASTMPFLLVFRAGGCSGGNSKDRTGVCLFQTRVNYLASMPFLSKQTFR
mmetsp:Transcript_1458/g.1759  ORF Transcript_1458/g.1759 Transcript_1458/m.1759 type:complete len:501 (-) Transcript_1458:1377-2879(-)